jgi:Protein of unknown function (DUF1592)/Protein of unknown function (DUF1588)/Protein of unknown function (DUF1595)/Protein of unknown function (DUF1585)
MVGEDSLPGMRNLRQRSYLGTAIISSIGILAGCGGGSGLPDGAGAGQNGGGGGTGAGASVGGTGTVGGNGNPNAGGSSGTGASSGTGSTGSGGVVQPEVCTPGVPATSQIPWLKEREYDNAVAELLGVTTVGSQGQKPSDLLLDDSVGSIDAYAWTAYQTTAEAVATQVMADPEKKAKFINCSAADAACLTTTIQTFGRKAFRRPLSDAEVAEFMKFNSLTPAPESPDEVAEAILFGFLVSPSFLLLPELVADETEAGATKLSDYEVATRLAITLWGSIPDATLSEAADQGLLSTKEQILEQAQRMVADRARTAPLIKAFHNAYFDMDSEKWKSKTHDPELYPEYTEATRAASRAEVDSLVEDITFNGGKFADLFLSNVGFVNKDTAAIYGKNPADFSEMLSKVELDPEERPGVLSRIGFLAANSSLRNTSPILRGAFVTSNMMGIAFGPPTPGATNTPDPEGTFSTMRELTEVKTGDGVCAECHGTYVNPPGFVLEKYNTVGEWQTVDPLGGEITGVAEVTVGQNGDQLVKKTISTPRQLMEEIGLGQRAQWNYTQKWITFVTGRLANVNDNCTVLDLGTKFAGDYTILDLLTDLTQTDSFRIRNTAP